MSSEPGHARDLSDGRRPANMMCKRFGPKIWLSFLSFGFGIVTTLTAVITTYEGLIIARIFLGALEAGIMPGISFTLSQL